MNWTNYVSAFANVATAVGIFFAWWQIKNSKNLAITQFEDSMAKEYREIAQRLPTKALLGEQLEQEEYRDSLDDFFHYIDLTNQEVFLRQKERISCDTWINWRDGIRSNLSRPAFKKAWEEIKSKATDSFSELRRLEDSGFCDDPHKWRKMKG